MRRTGPRSVTLAAVILGAGALGSACELVAISGTISGETWDAGAGGATGTTSATTSTGGAGAGTTTSSSSTTTTTPAPSCDALVAWTKIIDVGKASDVHVSVAPNGDVVVAATVVGDVSVEGTPKPGAATDDGGDVLVARYDANGNLKKAFRMADPGAQTLSGVVAEGNGAIVAYAYATTSGLVGPCGLQSTPPSTPTVAHLDNDGACLAARTVTDHPAQVARLAADDQNLYTATVPNYGGEIILQRLPRTLGPTQLHWSVSGAAFAPQVAGSGDASAYIVAAGTFSGTIGQAYPKIDIGTAAGTGKDAFLVRIGAAAVGAEIVGARTFAAGADAQIVYGLGADGLSPYLAGALRATMDFTGEPLTPADQSDVFVTRPGWTAGASSTWSQRFGGPKSEWATGLAVGGVVAVVGLHRGGLTVGGSPGGELATRGGQDVFVTTLDKDTGEVRWSCSFGGTGEDEGSDVALGSNNAVYVVGRVPADAHLGTDVHPTGDGGAIYLMRLDQPAP